MIKFTFNPQDLPHLLGLQHLVDNPILFEYSEKRLSATDLYNRMCSEGEDAVDTDEYICYQEKVLPYSMMKKDKTGTKTFQIYWEQVWESLRKNNHYKKLKNQYVTEDGTIDERALEMCDDEGILKHYELLQLDALDKIYLPYMKSDFRWTNDEKRFILGKIKCEKHDLMPGEIRHLLNEYKQKHS